MSSKTALEVAAEAKVLFSLPDIFFQLNQMIRDPRYSLADIGNVIAKDPGLSARLLRVVNSPLYGFQSKIDTISRAVSIIGVDDFYNLVLATSVVDRFAQIPSEFVDMTSFWQRSIHCGALTKLLAKMSGAMNIERLFLAGLLHDIGSLVLYQVMPEQSLTVLMTIQHDRRLLAGIEQELLGYTHADVGRELLKLWGLPASVYEVVGCYPSPALAVNHKSDAYLLHLAVQLIDDKEAVKPIEETLSEIPEQLLSNLRLNREQVEFAVEQSADEFLDVFNQFRFGDDQRTVNQRKR